MQQLVSESRFRPSADIRFRIVEDQGVVLRQRAAEVLILNELGARILRLVEDGKSLGEIVEELFASFDASRQTLERDVRSFLLELLEDELIEPRTPERE